MIEIKGNYTHLLPLPGSGFRRQSMRRFVLLLACLLLVPEGLPAQELGGGMPFSPGETLKYSLRWSLLPAGHAELTLREEDSATGLYQATGKVVSVGYVSNLYKVDDVFESIFRNPTFCSSSTHKTIHEAERHRDVLVEMDSRSRLSRVEVKDLENGTSLHRGEYSIPDCVYDILSALYMTRTRVFKVGQSFEFPLNDGAETIQIRVEVQAAEQIETAIGSFQTFRLEPDVFSGNLFKGKGRMFIWIAQDGARVPVQLRAQISVGTITATLSGIEREESVR
jgi:hypothetical protein